jgi:hypothetical protein
LQTHVYRSPIRDACVNAQAEGCSNFAADDVKASLALTQLKKRVDAGFGVRESRGVFDPLGQHEISQNGGYVKLCRGRV